MRVIPLSDANHAKFVIFSSTTPTENGHFALFAMLLLAIGGQYARLQRIPLLT
jgi:hypothetical protein